MQHPQAYAWALVLMVALALCALAVFVFALGMRRYPGMLAWAGGGFMMATGIFLMLQQGAWPLLASVIVANLCLVGGGMLAAAGLRRFLGRRVPWRVFAVVLASLACWASWYTWVRFSLPARVLVFSLHMLVVYADLALVAWRAWRTGSPWPALLIAGSNVVSGVFAVGRGAAALSGALDAVPSVFIWKFAAYGAFVVGPPAVVVHTAGFLLLAGYRSTLELRPGRSA
ncbi:hypothetical protein RVX_R10810 [Nitratidesulfovibrio sp. HK-II]|uniref:hypothetical protein n=1 Tax=Nitratidesulfovibrio sp. HK-II TaxID=2009266 RepID=UPI000E2FD5BF|nr:hypothetical protein [Nitratidesulfovibrio sp. HK-II]GBO95372.1 PAS/PAC sensor signal transduction histidine kinase [Nitratidesulfovibrio sp. HK-II]